MDVVPLAKIYQSGGEWSLVQQRKLDLEDYKTKTLQTEFKGGGR
jgi:hypothetical protein